MIFDQVKMMGNFLHIHLRVFLCLNDIGTIVTCKRLNNIMLINVAGISGAVGMI